MDHGAELLRRYEVEDIPGLESRIQEIQDEKKRELNAAEKESLNIQTKLRNEIQRLQNELEARQVESSKTQDELKHAQDQLKTQGKGAAKTQAELEAAQKLLEVRVYTQEQYEQGFKNGFKVARRLAFHDDPAINWDLAEAWSMDP
ncbi:tropomyosin-like [Chenopodium quinoa]|uniref:tropomyosin-like n=1 Tax=Chenopodium quinoa TaxID=63459 RepID=UPI000B784B71|nr:tropomyosin-like [Chenopodium quinoa]